MKPPTLIISALLSSDRTDVAVFGAVASFDAGVIVTSDGNGPQDGFMRGYSIPVEERIEYVYFVFPGPIFFVPQIGTFVRIRVSEWQ